VRKIKETRKKTFITTIMIALTFLVILGTMPFASAQTDIKITDVTFSNDEPVEGEEITVYATVLNNESIRVSNITIQFFIMSEIEQRKIMNLTLEAKESLTVNITWIAKKWEHTVMVGVSIVEDTILMGSMMEKKIWVEAKPVGDLPTLGLALMAIFAIVLGATCIPSVKEKFYRK